MLSQGVRQLEQAILDTVRYFDFFQVPLTATQIWRSLIIDRDGHGVRWHRQPVPSLALIKDTLSNSTWLARQVTSVWGYYCWRRAVPDADNARSYVRRYLHRHALAQQKWKITRRVARWLAALPLVKMIGVTGSLAMFNTNPTSDLDLFVIVAKGRVWLTRLLLILLTEMQGRRRRYWHKQAPDKICLNHYISDDQLLMNPAIHNIYTAVSYHQLVLLSGQSTYQCWQQSNETWLKRWLMFPPVRPIKSRLAFSENYLHQLVKKLTESVLLELPGDVLEKLAEKVQRYFITKHSIYHQYGRINLSSSELAFHPATKVPGIVRQFQEEAGQRQLL